MGNDDKEYDTSDSREPREDGRQFFSNESEKSLAPPVEIPREYLSHEAIAALVESFILREGTDYGAVEIAFETKQRQVQKQLDNGDIKIVFDPDSESATLMKKEDWQRLMK